MKKKYPFTLLILLFIFFESYSQDEKQHNPISEELLNDFVEKFDQHIYEVLPDYSLSDVDGNIVKLSDFKQKVILLEFWATWCAPCVSGIPVQKEIMERLENRKIQDFIWVNVSVDSDSTAWKKMVESKAIPGINLICELDIAEKIYNIEHYPTVVLINNKREIIGFDIANPGWGRGPTIEFLIIQGLNGVKSSDAFRKIIVPGKAEVGKEFKEWSDNYFGKDYIHSSN